MDGLIIVDKPRGWTSHDVVARVRRLTGERRTGHAGTLDPLATGVLPLGLGQGTRVLEYLSEAGKGYRAVVRLGVSTDTYDADGAVTATAPVSDVSRARIEAELAHFRGAFEQRPPLFSAIKRNGRPLYKYARAGLSVEIPARTVRIDSLALRSYEPPDLELEIECASGFYVRSLAHDLGERLGCGAHLRALVRTRVGPFDLDDTVDLEALAEAAAGDRLADRLWAIDMPLRGRPAVILAAAHTGDVVNGRPLVLPERVAFVPESLCRAYSAAGDFIAVLRLHADRSARPLKVFPLNRGGPGPEVDDRPIAVCP